MNFAKNAMNTTHTISNKTIIPYTVVGGLKQETAPVLTILLLNRGGRFYREELLKELTILSFAEIICIEGPELSYDIEPLSRKFQGVRFLLLKDSISTGEKINLGFEESHSDYIMVLWSDIKFLHSTVSSRIVHTMESEKLLCSIPVFRNHKKEIIPTIQVPGFIKRKLKIIPWKTDKEGIKSIYPFDYCGIYNKEKFTKLGGFDSLITNPYWQKLDFGFRAYLWGEKIVLNPSFSLIYTIDVVTEDNTPDTSYKRFYLKNLSVKYQGGIGQLKWYKFMQYMLHSDTNPFYSLSEFMAVRKWVKQNTLQFKASVKSVINTWEAPE